MSALEMHDVVVTHAGRRLVDVPHLRIELSASAAEFPA